MKRQGLLPAVVSFAAMTTVVVVVVAFAVRHRPLIGPVLIALGFLPWIPLRLSGRTIRSAGADIVFGTIDTGPLTIAALIGASLAGVLGAIVGGVVGDAITDGLAGMFEGKMAEALRRHGIEEARTPLSSSMGKMSGCLLGAGTVLTIVWTLLRIPT